MNIFSRGGRAAARSWRQHSKLPSRRYASDGAYHEHGHGESAIHVPGGPSKESFGSSFYIILAGIPIASLTYLFAVGGDSNFLTRLTERFSAKAVQQSEKEGHNTMMTQQAILDRQLFRLAERDQTGPDISYPERFNMGGRYINASPGQVDVNLDDVAAFYKDKYDKMEKARIARMAEKKD